MWFIGKIKEDEFLMNCKGELLRFKVNSLPDKFPEKGFAVIECPYNLTQEQYHHIKEAWRKVSKRKVLLLEGGIKIRILDLE